jgi:hypothetical protein
VPSRACLPRRWGVGGGVGDELAVDDIGQAAAQAAHGFHGGFGLLQLAPVLGTAGGVVAQLDHPGHVQDVV